MKRMFAVVAAVAFLGVAACDNDVEDEPFAEEGAELDVTPAPPPAPVVTDTMPMDTLGQDTLGMDTLRRDTL